MSLQTGTGKTHTMIGTEEEPGMIPLVNILLFSLTCRPWPCRKGSDEGSGGGDSVGVRVGVEAELEYGPIKAILLSICCICVYVPPLLKFLFNSILFFLIFCFCHTLPLGTSIDFWGWYGYFLERHI